MTTSDCWNEFVSVSFFGVTKVTLVNFSVRKLSDTEINPLSAASLIVVVCTRLTIANQCPSLIKLISIHTLINLFQQLLQQQQHREKQQQHTCFTRKTCKILSGRLAESSGYLYPTSHLLMQCRQSIFVWQYSSGSQGLNQPLKPL